MRPLPLVILGLQATWRRTFKPFNPPTYQLFGSKYVAINLRNATSEQLNRYVSFILSLSRTLDDFDGSQTITWIAKQIRSYDAKGLFGTYLLFDKSTGEILADFTIIADSSRLRENGFEVDVRRSGVFQQVHINSAQVPKKGRGAFAVVLDASIFELVQFFVDRDGLKFHIYVFGNQTHKEFRVLKRRGSQSEKIQCRVFEPAASAETNC